MSKTSGAGSRPVAPFIGPRRKPIAWGMIGNTALGGPAFTKHTLDDAGPDYLAVANGDPLTTEAEDLEMPWLEGLLDEVGREPMPVIKLPEIPTQGRSRGK